MDNLHLGPAGGDGGHPFANYDIPDDARITAVHIFIEHVIAAIQFDIERADGTAEALPPVGGPGGTRLSVYLDDDEYLTGISGRAGWYVDSLRLHTNKRVSPLYGGPGGERDYVFEAPAGYEVFGLFGRSGWYIDALGIIARPRLTPDEEHEDEDEPWYVPVDEGDPVPVRVVVRREIIQSPGELDDLEEEALAEALAEMSADEGTADAAVYSQVLEDVDSRGDVAVVLAVAGEAGAIEDVGDDRGEVAIMVTDAIESDEDLSMLEEEAVQEAVDRFLDEVGEDRDEVVVTIYSGMVEDEDSGLTYGAAVALVSDTVTRTPSRTEAVDLQEPHQPRPKDLQLVEGIGPKIAALLIDNGILDLADLAAAPVERIRAILDAGGRRFRLADPTTWAEQAALGAGGAMEALQALQARLKGGKEAD